MNAAAKKTAACQADAIARARALRADRAQQALRAPLVGRTLDTAQSVELTSDERRERMAATKPAFEGL